MASRPRATRSRTRTTPRSSSCVHGLVIAKSNDAPIESLELPDGSTADLPTADEGSTVTFTLHYTFSGAPVTHGVITDVLPIGLTYVGRVRDQ